MGDLSRTFFKLNPSHNKLLSTIMCKKFAFCASFGFIKKCLFFSRRRAALVAPAVALLNNYKSDFDTVKVYRYSTFSVDAGKIH